MIDTIKLPPKPAHLERVRPHPSMKRHVIPVGDGFQLAYLDENGRPLETLRAKFAYRKDAEAVCMLFNGEGA